MKTIHSGTELNTGDLTASAYEEKTPYLIPKVQASVDVGNLLRYFHKLVSIKRLPTSTMLAKAGPKVGIGRPKLPAIGTISAEEEVVCSQGKINSKQNTARNYIFYM